MNSLLFVVGRRSQSSQPDNKPSDWSEDSEEKPPVEEMEKDKEQVGIQLNKYLETDCLEDSIQCSPYWISVIQGIAFSLNDISFGAYKMKFKCMVDF